MVGLIAGAVAKPVIGALAGGIANGLITNYQTKKLANAYKEAAKDIREAGKKYSGQAADAAMTQEGARQGQQMQKLAQSQGVAGTTGLSTADATNMTQDQPGLSAYMQGQNLGRNTKATELNSKYNAATAKAQNMLSKANTDYKAGRAATQFGMNLLSGATNTINNIGSGDLMNAFSGAGGAGAGGGMNALTSAGGGAGAAGAASLLSDENCKESITNSSGDKIPTADVEDALRQIESIEYQYKPETGLDQDKHVGISAQSIEGTSLDNGTVHNDGPYKTLDKQKLLESVMAGIAAMQKEIDSINSKRMTSDVECKQAAQVVEDKIESSPDPVETAETIAPGAENIKEEAEQINDGNPHNVEVNNEKVEEDIDNIVIGYNNGRVSDPADWKDNPTYNADPIDLSDDSASNVVDYGLEDQNQYVDDINDPTVVDTKAPEVDEDAFVKSDVLPSADNVLELKPEEQEVVTKAIEEAAPEEDKETYFGMLGLPHRNIASSATTPSVKDDTYKLNRLNKAGSAILGNLNKALPTSSGSVSASNVGDVDKSSKPMTSEIANSAGGSFLIKGPTESANAEVGSKPGNSNNGFTTSNGGNVSSGPVDKSGFKTSQHSLPGNTLHTAEANNIDLGEASKEALKAAIIKLDDKVAAENDIDKEALKYKGISIDDLPPELINELWGILNG